jgi:hypothetical protein
LKLAFSVFMNQNVRTLIEEKTQLRNLKLSYAESHLARLREGRPESIEPSFAHLFGGVSGTGSCRGTTTEPAERESDASVSDALPPTQSI